MKVFLFKSVKLAVAFLVVSGGLAGRVWAQTGPAVPIVPGPKPELRLQLKNEASRNKLLLSSLFGRLRQVEDAQTAKVLEKSIWQVWLRSGSATIDLLMEQVIKALDQQRSTKALKILNHIVRMAPEFAEGWNKRATVLYLVGQYQASLEDIERVLALEPRHFGALSGRGMILQILDDKKSALEAYREALTIHPHLAGPKRAVEILTTEVEGRKI